MRQRALLSHNEFAQKVHDIWSKSSKWVEKNIFELLGLDPATATLDDIDEKLLVRNLKKIRGRIERLRKKRRKDSESPERKWEDLKSLATWKDAWGFGWYRAGCVLVFIVGIASASLPFIHH